ncbi:hypothetical protein [Ruegeria lacuscaerulensis]|uniref:hypothetical protein n=1 Tax=Ruegeria lacuscaerulensis TaxID=55218 RepID=UPI00147D7306|nr:hypothetical protein [Ruegeria lacuscaerulensis]
MVKLNKYLTELFPVEWKSSIPGLKTTGDGSSKSIRLGLELAVPASVFFLLLAYCLHKASVENYVSVLM